MIRIHQSCRPRRRPTSESDPNRGMVRVGMRKLWNSARFSRGDSDEIRWVRTSDGRIECSIDVGAEYLLPLRALVYMHLNIKCLSRIEIKPRVRSSMLSIYPYVKLWKLHVWTIVFTWNVLSDEFHEMNTKIIISSSSVLWLWKWWLPINRGFQFICNECIHISISMKMSFDEFLSFEMKT